MNKKIQLTIYFCLGAIILAAYFLKPVKQVAMISNSQPQVQPVHNSAIKTAIPGPVIKPVPVQTAPVSDNPGNLSVTRQISDGAPAQDDNDSAELEKNRLLRSLRAWAAKDPEAALAAAMKLPEGDERNQALSAVCLGLAETNPADAVKLAQTLNLDKQPGAVMESLVQQWAGTDLASALVWANSQPAGDQRDGFTTRIAFVMSQSNPTDAANLVINQISPGPIQDEAVMTVLNQWGNQNLAAAATWVKGFPEGPLQARAAAELEGIADHLGALAHQ
jgi:hypothetical protein